MTPETSYWDRWLARLASVGEIDEQPGRLVLTAEGRRLEIVMTEHEWDDLVSIAFGQLESAISFEIEAAKSALSEGVPFLVYSLYNLVASPTATIPSRWPGMERRIAEARRANPDATFGWYAYPPNRDESP